MIFLVPYAYDRMPGGKPREGVPPNRLGSKARCDALVNIAHRCQVEGLWHRFVLCAGYTKGSPTTPTEEIQESIAHQMEMYLLSINNHFFPITGEKAWGTYEETGESIRRISYSVDVNWVIKTEVYVSTNLGHMPRVWLCWFFLKPKSWKVHFVLANHSFTPKEWTQETAKFFQYLYRFVFKKW